ncbi:ROK family protein [Streptomyces sp. SP18CS02]|uniref:ROK family protein n=1 Tax=Streptomyces sp. SP18CS02 TaxID=3002531 RepID=UPI002E764231|nr:ROK family protein [Streptomyces sp. SP18CS02]MEE1756454.1 ROK family protein [Streptomyces sp. SP18CS02]
MSRAVAVLDVGGTHIRQAWWLSGNGLRARRSRPSPSFRRFPGVSVAKLQDLMVQDLCEAVPESPDAVAGISFGAALDHRSGLVYASAPLWGEHSEPFDLRGALRTRRPDVDWHIVNDVTAALLHAASAPARREHRKVLLATISTGIACRTLDRRRDVIPVDGCGLQGEIGHLPATASLAGAPVELVCDCGVRGHLAAYASGPGIARMAAVLQEREPDRWERSVLGRLTTDGASFETALCRALDVADTLAAELLDAVTAPVADVLRTALCLDPEIDEAVLTGGVVLGLGEHYRRSLLDHLTRQGLYLTSERSPEWVERRVTVSGPGEADGLAGAGIAALAELRP